MSLQFFRHNIHNKYNIYYFGFIFCEFLNLVVTVICFFATNRFLANRWLGYGFKVWHYIIIIDYIIIIILSFKVWHYYQLPLEEQEMKMAGKYIHTNPMCYTFPRYIQKSMRIFSTLSMVCMG